MGGNAYDYSTATSMVDAGVASGRLMSHSVAISRGEVAQNVHPMLDPKLKNRAGLVIRESRDSENHPNSVPVAIIFDTTGSMGSIPEQIAKVLPQLMNLILTKGYLVDPQILFGAVNDATTYCVAPLEVGQFESGAEMGDVLTKIYVGQGGGGGSSQESYELAMYFMARKTVLDSLDKRNKKGYLFIVGDEQPYDFVSKDEVERYIGDKLQADIPTEDIVAELKQKFDVYWLYPAHGSNRGNRSIQTKLTSLFGQNLIQLQDEKDICTAIAATIAVNEGKDPHTVIDELKKGPTATSTHTALVDAIVASIPPRKLDDL